jgi:hypothetical protein
MTKDGVSLPRKVVSPFGFYPEAKPAFAAGIGLTWVKI